MGRSIRVNEPTDFSYPTDEFDDVFVVVTARIPHRQLDQLAPAEVMRIIGEGVYKTALRKQGLQRGQLASLVDAK